MEDFPAAHSMDSGWFAIDEDGNLAHFDTGEGGAIAVTGKYYTGEMDRDGIDTFYFQSIAPWIARNNLPERFENAEDCFALFETEEFAAAAAKKPKQIVEANAFLVDVSGLSETDRSELYGTAGFVGVAPSFYELLWEEEPDVCPFFRYGHGDWEIPGNYVVVPETGDPKFKVEPLEGLDRLNVKFRESPDVNIADFYDPNDCEAWGEVDIRTGEPEGTPLIPEGGILKAIKSWFK